MSDLFHEHLTDDEIDQVFAVMMACPQHTFQVLTKRPERMYCYSRTANAEALGVYYTSIFECLERPEPSMPTAWPLPNVWLGVSVEDQKTADERIPLLLQTPAAVRWLSVEPLLGPVNLGGYARHLDWVVVGGESGPGARPMHLDWARSLRVQCIAEGVPFFFKQWGDWMPTEIKPGGDLGGDMRRGNATIVHAPGNREGHFTRGDAFMSRVGKKAAGRLLDGREWNEYPEAIGRNPGAGANDAEKLSR